MRMFLTLLSLSLLACSEAPTEPSTSADAAEQDEEDSGYVEPVEAREAEGMGGGALLPSCYSSTATMNKMRNTLNDLYSCNEGSWYNTTTQFTENNTCYYNKTRKVQIALQHQNNNYGCMYYINRSKSGPSTPTCHWLRAECAFNTPPTKCVLTTWTGANSCVGYN